MKHWFIVAAAIALLTASVRAQEEKAPAKQPEGRGGPRMEGFFSPRLAERIELTDAQKATLKDMTDKFVAEREKTVDDLKAGGTDIAKMREEAMAARKAGEQEKAQELLGKLHEASKPIQELRAKYVEQFKATLTAEQKAKLETAMKEMQQRRPGPGRQGGEGRKGDDGPRKGGEGAK